MRVLIFGASGLLGKTLMQAWRGDDVVGLTSRQADIRDAQKVNLAIEKTCPDWVVLAAAYTDVDGCEANPELAFAVNRDGAVNVASAAKNNGARLLFISSDYVFDGEKTTPYEIGDPRNPRSVYGKTKAEAEIRLLERIPECCIVRTSWLFGTGGRCFPSTILKLAAERSSIDVVNDQRGCPTSIVDLSRVIVNLCHHDASGIVHVTNAGDCTWFEFATEIVRGAGLATAVNPVSSRKMARPASRPAYSVLSPSSLQARGTTLPSWRDALHRYLEERRRQEP